MATSRKRTGQIFWFVPSSRASLRVAMCLSMRAYVGLTQRSVVSCWACKTSPSRHVFPSRHLSPVLHCLLFRSPPPSPFARLPPLPVLPFRPRPSPPMLQGDAW